MKKDGKKKMDEDRYIGGIQVLKVKRFIKVMILIPKDFVGFRSFVGRLHVQFHLQIISMEKTRYETFDNDLAKGERDKDANFIYESASFENIGDGNYIPKRFPQKP